MSGKDLRIIFMGTPEFAVAGLKSLFESGYNIVGVVTVPDKPAGRGKLVTPSAVKKYALEKNLMLLQPDKLKDPEFIISLNNLKPDLIVVVAFRMLPKDVWSIPRLGTFNLHSSLLPQYRGAAPINWAIINGETTTGLTTFFIDEQIDTGNVIFQEATEISPNETAGDLHDRLMEIGGGLLIKTVDSLAHGSVAIKPQAAFDIPHENLKSAPKIFKEDCKVNWDQEVSVVHNFIRGLSPHPAAYAEWNLNGEPIVFKIFEVSMDFGKPSEIPGTIVSDQKNFLKVACRNGYINILNLQQAGKKRLNSDQFLRGYKDLMLLHP